MGYAKGQTDETVGDCLWRWHLPSEGRRGKLNRTNGALFGHTFIMPLADPIADLAVRQLEGLEGVRNLDEDFMELTLELVMRLLFGNTIGNDLNTLSESFNTIGVYFSKIMSQVPVPLWVPIPRNVRYNRGMSNLRSVIQRILDERRANGGHMHNDILSRILEDSDTLPALDENQIHDELRTLMLAGHETTSLALTYSAGSCQLTLTQEELFAERSW